MKFELLNEADYVLDACGREVPPDGFRFVDLPRVIPFHATIQGAAGSGQLCAGFPGASSFPTEVTPTSQWSEDNVTNNVGPVGPFSDIGSRRALILFDDTAFKMRAFFSTNKGATWAEQDSAHAPACANDVGSPAPGDFQYYGVCQDTQNRLLYLVFWDTDYTISVIPFNLSTLLWGTKVKSTLTYLSGSQPVSSDTGFGVVFRPSDNSVWFMFAAGITGGGTVPNRVWGAQFTVGTSTWGALVNLGTADNTDLHDWQVVGMTGPDPAGDLHLFFMAVAGTTFIPTPPFTNFLYHRVMRADNSLGSIDVVASTTNNSVRLNFSEVGYPFCSGDGELSLVYKVIVVGGSGFQRRIVRGAFAENPVWEDLLPADPTLQGNSFGFFSTFRTPAGVDYCVYTFPDPDGIHLDFMYMTSPGIGQAWGFGAPIAKFDTTGSAAISNSVQGAPALGSLFAITMSYSPPPGTSDGQGYFEAAGCVGGLQVNAVPVFQSSPIMLQIVAPAVTQAFSVTVSGTTVTVNPQSIGTTILTTWAQLVLLLNANPQVTALFLSSLLPGTNPAAAIVAGTVLLSNGSISTALPTKERVSNNSKTLFLVKGMVAKVDPGLQVRVKWPDGRFMNQQPSGDQTITGACFPQGAGGNMLAFNKPREIERGGLVSVEISGNGVGNVDLQFWGVLRYLLKVVNGTAQPDSDTCIIGYPSRAKGQKLSSCLVGYSSSMARIHKQRPATLREAKSSGGFAFSMMPDPADALEKLPRYLCDANSNIFAPEFRLGNQASPEIPEGEDEESFTFFSPVIVVPVGSEVYGTAVVIPTRSDVVVKRVRVVSTWDGPAAASGAIPQLGLRLPNGYSWTGGDMVPTGLLWWVPVFPTLRLKGGERIVVDLSNYGYSSIAGNITSVVEFDAVRRVKL